jgi:type I restriction enzyme S subunit
MNTEYGKNIIEPLSRRAAQAHLNADQTKNMLFIYPPLPLQQKFADIITQIDAQKSEHKLVLAKLEELYQTTMQKSFSL